MSRVLRTLLVTQATVLLVALAVVSHSQNTGLADNGPLAVTPPLPPVVHAAVARPVPPPAAKRVTKPQRAPRPHVIRHRRHHAHRATAAVVVRPRVTASAVRVATSGSAQQRMEQAVARIPGYTKGAATWFLAAKDGYWGTADWYHNVIYISPTVPANRIYDVVAHEWSHLKSVQVYGGDVDAAMAAMNRYFSSTGLGGSERAADCMARRLGATWTHYTPCADPHWQAGAGALLAGKQV